MIFRSPFTAHGRGSPPALWSAPVGGEIKTISYAAGTHPAGPNGGAILAEIDPIYQSWNPAAPAVGPYGGTSGNYFFSSIQAYGGSAFNADTRELVSYGGGHVAFNVPAPFAFRLSDLTWRWLDVPLPIDGLDLIRANALPVPPSQSNVETYYPPEQFDYAWGDWSGDWSGWPSGYGRAGKIQPNPTHSRAKLTHIPGLSAGNVRGKMLWYGSGAGILSGANSLQGHVFDFDSGDWARTANRMPADLLSSASGIVHDKVSNKLIIAGSTGASTLAGLVDVASPAFSTVNSSNSIAVNGDGPGALITSDGIVLLPYAKNAGGTVATDNTGITFGMHACLASEIVSGTFAWTALDVTGSQWPLNGSGNNNKIGWGVCDDDGNLYAINGVNGSNKYWKMTRPADPFNDPWTVTEHTFTVGTLASPGSTSPIYNKTHWDAQSRSFIWHGESINCPVQAWRPLGL